MLTPSPSPSSGSLCNFCTRLHHDYDTSAAAVEKWKRRIAKCLMDGADRGRTMKLEVQGEEGSLGCHIADM